MLRDEIRQNMVERTREAEVRGWDKRQAANSLIFDFLESQRMPSKLSLLRKRDRIPIKLKHSRKMRFMFHKIWN